MAKRVYLLRTLHQNGVPFIETHSDINRLPQGYTHQGRLIKTVEDLAAVKKFYSGQNWAMELLDDIDPETLEG